MFLRFEDPAQSCSEIVEAEETNGADELLLAQVEELVERRLIQKLDREDRLIFEWRIELVENKLAGKRREGGERLWAVEEPCRGVASDFGKGSDVVGPEGVELARDPLGHPRVVDLRESILN